MAVTMHLVTRLSATLVPLLLLLLTFVPALAQTGGVLGTVIHADSELPVVDAVVEGVVEDLLRRTTTGPHGEFSLQNVPAGTFSLRITGLGYESWSGSVEVSVGGNVRVVVQLEAEPIPVDPVVVLMDRTRLLGSSADQCAIPGSVQVLTRRELQVRGAVFDNVHDMLRHLPGVNVQEEEGYGLRPNIGLRGTGVERSSKITLMEDGVLIAPAPYAAPAAYYFPTAGRMEAVEVRKGSSQIKYGPRTIGGAINLVSSSIPDRRSWALDAAGSEHSTYKLRGRVGDSGERVGWLLETYQLGTDGFKRLPGGEDTGFRVGDYLAKLRVSSDRGSPLYHEIELKAGYTDHRSNETYLGLTDEDFQVHSSLRYPASQNDVMEAEHLQLQVRYFLQVNEGLDLTATLYRNDFRRNWNKLQSVGGANISSVLADPEANAEELAILQGAESGADALTVRANNREYYSQGASAALGFRFGEGIVHEVQLGVRFHHDEEDRFQHEDGFEMRNGVMELTSAGAPGTQSNRVSDASATSVYLEDEITIDRLRITPGVRFETVDFSRTDYASDDPRRAAAKRRQQNSVSALIPGLGLTYSMAGNTHLFAGVHRGFGPPGPGSAQKTEPEESINYEIGLRLRRSAMNAQVSTFFSDYTNILGTATLATGGSGTGEQFNGGSVRVAGVEVAAAYDLLWQRAVTHSPPSFFSRVAGTYPPQFTKYTGPSVRLEKGVSDRWSHLRRRLGTPRRR